jgi:ribosomal protein S8
LVSINPLADTLESICNNAELRARKEVVTRPVSKSTLISCRVNKIGVIKSRYPVKYNVLVNPS